MNHETLNPSLFLGSPLPSFPNFPQNLGGRISSAASFPPGWAKPHVESRLLGLASAPGWMLWGRYGPPATQGCYQLRRSDKLESFPSPGECQCQPSPSSSCSILRVAESVATGGSSSGHDGAYILSRLTQAWGRLFAGGGQPSQYHPGATSQWTACGTSGQSSESGRCGFTWYRIHGFGGHFAE